MSKAKVYIETSVISYLTNATTRPVVEHICRTQGYEPVIICTPEELLEE